MLLKIVNFRRNQHLAYHYTSKLRHKRNVALAIYAANIANDVYSAEQRYALELCQKWFDNPSDDIIKLMYELSPNLYDEEHSSPSRAMYTVYAPYFNNKAAIYSAGVVDLNLCGSVLTYLDALLNKKLPKTPCEDTLEKLVYINDKLEYPILVPYKGKFRLNLWDKRYGSQIIGSVEEIANTTGVKNLLKACTDE